MKCDKVVFKSMKEGNKRAMEIKSYNAKHKVKDKNKLKELRPYKCESCGKIHLTSMTKHYFKTKTKHRDPDYITKIREERFIKKESEYWEDKFNIE